MIEVAGGIGALLLMLGIGLFVALVAVVVLDIWLELLDAALGFGSFVCLVAAIICLSVADAHREHEEQEAFLRECLQDRKEYECVAMWRGGHKSSNMVVTPMTVVVQ